MAGIATPVRPAAKGAERDGRADGGTAWGAGLAPPTKEELTELTALGDGFLPEDAAPPGAQKHVLPPRKAYSPSTVLATGPEAFADPVEPGPQSLDDFPMGQRTLRVGGPVNIGRVKG